ncbi:hypothetical protein [Kitasatospora sp. NPDC092286]|uniref:hypothetical protein n=1 Tax=Kitasatospora sp. NPDC092286 TaxID=3364087 RepID=UPI00382A87B5
MADRTSPLWAAAERSDGAWEVVDNRTSMLYVIDGTLGARLWQNDQLWTIPLQAAFDVTVSQIQTHPTSNLDDEGLFPFLDVEVGGVTVRYLADDKAHRDTLQVNLGVARPRLRGTADVLLRLRPGVRIDLLHRSVSGNRAGVEYRMPRDPRWRPYTGMLPALPPLLTPPYRRRFSALHAALLVMPSGRSVIVCGNQKAGKTTAARWARDTGLAATATDEVVLLDTMTGVAFGVPLAQAVRQGDQRTTVPLPAGSATHLGATLPIGLVVLTPAPAVPAGFLQAAGTEKESMAWLAEHMRDAGADPAATRRIVRELVSRVHVHRLGVSPWPGLQTDLAAGLAPLLKTLEQS